MTPTPRQPDDAERLRARAPPPPPPNATPANANAFPGMLAAELGPGEHAVLILDQAGRHRSKASDVPENVTCLLLPPYSPESNPVEDLWH